MFLNCPAYYQSVGTRHPLERTRHPLESFSQFTGPSIPLRVSPSSETRSWSMIEEATRRERLVRLLELVPDHRLTDKQLDEVINDEPKQQIDRLIRGSLHPKVAPTDAEYADDRENIKSLTKAQLKVLYLALARFLSGEKTVEEELDPACRFFQKRASEATSEEDWKKVLYLKIQIAEEREHREAFEAYQQHVIRPHNEELKDPRVDSYLSTRGFTSIPFRVLFDQLLPRTLKFLDNVKADTVPGKLALISAFLIYHGFAESVIARTAYHGFFIALGERTVGAKTLPPQLSTLLKIFGVIAKDEQRHVGFGMDVLRETLRKGSLSARFAYTSWACLNIAALSVVTAGIVGAVFCDGITYNRKSGFSIFPFPLRVRDLAGQAWANTSKLLEAVLPPLLTKGLGKIAGES
jgi:ribonucleoside-diphosphate reductase beta chain